MLEIIDLSSYPKTHFHPEETVLTIGDLHANPILLIYFLQKNNIISMDENTYKYIYILYKEIAEQQKLDRNVWTPALKEKYEEFIDILKKIVVNPCKIKIRFLGDELADRGECDLFIMLIFSKLHQSNILFSILVSNHGIAFLSSIQYILYQKCLDETKTPIYPEDMPSFLGLQKLVHQDLISKEFLHQWLERVYLPHLELLDYGLSRDLNTFYIFTHAAMGLQQLKALADEYQVHWCDENVNELALSLKNMKKIFQNSKKIELMNLFRTDALEAEEKLISLHLVDTVFWRDLIWNRKYEITRPFNFHSYRVFNVHGHDQSCKENHDYFISLDSYLGKYYHITKGHMKTLVMQEKPIEQKNKPFNSADYFTFFKPLVCCMPSLNQSLLLLGLGYVFKSQLFFLPFIDYIFEHWPNSSKLKLVKN